jgi:putative tryptophan/tyrosine transport system substrate-binding protein
LAEDLVDRNVSVIATVGPPAAFAVKAATKTIPSLFIVAQDPVELGLVASLAKPGGNFTGVNLFNTEVTAKRLDLLRTLVPKLNRIAVLVNSADLANTNQTVREINGVVARLGASVHVLDVNTSDKINAAFEKIKNARSDALFVGASPYLNGRHVQLAQLAAFHHIPATYALRESVEAGGLMSYGTDVGDAYRQSGIYAGRILKGAKPADLPVVQTSKFELVINAQTARMLGLVIPPSLLSLADEVIE